MLDISTFKGMTPAEYLERARENNQRLIDAARPNMSATLRAIADWAKTRQAQPAAAAPDVADFVVENIEPTAPPTKSRKVGRYVLPNFGFLARSTYTPVDPIETRKQVNTVVWEFKRLGVLVECRKVTASAAAVRLLCRLVKDGNKSKAADVTSKANDIALALGVPSVRITPAADEANAMAIEYPRADRLAVTLGDIAASAQGDGLLIPAGLATDGRVLVFDLAKQPHVLFSGGTGSGKTTFATSLLMALLMNKTPDAVRLSLIDIKGELAQFDGVPHLVGPIATDTAAASAALDCAIAEMDNRYNRIKATKTRDIAGYNVDNPRPMPYLVVVVDECAQLIEMDKDKTLAQLGTLARLGRAAGVHLVVGMQRPDASILDGEIKANLMGRAVFRLSSPTDSNVALGKGGAELLRGNGDGLLAVDGNQPVRFQGAYSSPEDVARIVAYWERYSAPSAVSVAPVKPDTTQPAQPAPIPAPMARVEPLQAQPAPPQPAQEVDADVERARDLIRGMDYVSATKLKAGLKCRYDRAAAVLEALVALGLVSADATGNRGHKVITA